MFGVNQHYSKHCSCHFQGGYVVGQLLEAMATAMFAEMLVNPKHSTQLTPESRSCTLNSSRKTYRQEFNILPLASEFLLSLPSFMADNMEKFQTNSDIHSINTRHKHDLHQPCANLTSYQNGAYYAGFKLFNTLPDSIKSLNHDVKVFKPALKGYLLSHSFYSVE
jgi:hypothetical protein